jgi:lauroyl/myristoyl acyltransferase
MRVILCHGVRDLKKQHYVLHASDPMSRSKRSEETTLPVTCEWSYVTESGIWRNNITCHMRVILCHGVKDLKKQHYVSHVSDPMSQSKRSDETTLRVTCEWSYVTESEIWRNNITCHMRVILCHGVKDLKKQHYVSHVSDHMSWSKRSEETTLRVTCEWSYVTE